MTDEKTTLIDKRILVISIKELKVKWVGFFCKLLIDIDLHNQECKYKPKKGFEQS